jgi:hypothetical protein
MRRVINRDREINDADSGSAIPMFVILSQVTVFEQTVNLYEFGFTRERSSPCQTNYLSGLPMFCHSKTKAGDDHEDSPSFAFV